MKTVFLFLIISLISIIGCSDNPVYDQSAILTRQFEYSGHDLNGNIISYGIIRLNIQSNKIYGERNLKDMGGNADTGSVAGAINSNGSFEINFDPARVLRIYVSLEGKNWSTKKIMSGIIFSYSGTGIWSDTTGTFTLLELF